MYVNGYVMAVPEEKKDAYIATTKVFAEIAKEFGALEVPDGGSLVQGSRRSLAITYA